MYRGKYKGQNHEVIGVEEEITSNEIYSLQEKEKKPISFKKVFQISLFMVVALVIGVGIWVFSDKDKILKLLNLEKSKNVIVLGVENTNTDQAESKLTGVEQSSLPAKSEEENQIDLVAIPMQAAVLKGELFNIGIFLRGNFLNNKDSLEVKFDPVQIEATKVFFSEEFLNGSEKIDDLNGSVEVRSEDLLNVSNLSLIFLAKNEGLSSIKIKLGNLEKEVRINVVFIEAAKPNLECGVVNLLEAPIGTSIFSGPKIGQAMLFWQKKDERSFLSIKYGTKTGMYEFGENFVKDNGEFIVSNLKPGERYYFVLQRIDSCNKSRFSQEMSAVAGYGAMTKTNEMEGVVLPISGELIP